MYFKSYRGTEKDISRPDIIIDILQNNASNRRALSKLLILICQKSYFPLIEYLMSVIQATAFFLT